MKERSTPALIIAENLFKEQNSASSDNRIAEKIKKSKIKHIKLTKKNKKDA